MIDLETRSRIRRLFYVEHWKVGTIARELGLHAESARLALETERFNRPRVLRPRVTDAYADFIREILARHPRLRATRIYHMIRDRGYTGSIVQLRRFVAEVRPAHREAFLSLRTFPGEQGQVDWAHFGEVAMGRARRRLSCFVITLSYSRALYLESSSTSVWKASCAPTCMHLKIGRVFREACCTTTWAVSCWNGGAMRFIFIPDFWNWRRITILPPIRVRRAPEIRKGVSSA